MSRPSVGRQVWYYPLSFERFDTTNTQPFAATITRVWSSQMVNLHVLRDDGIPLLNKTSVTLVESAQPGQCQWPIRDVPGT